VTYDSSVYVHPTAIIEKNVFIGANSKIWDSAHIREGAQVGHDCIVGEKTYIGPGVIIGNYVKINAMVYIPVAVIIEDYVMISAGVVFTNDKSPRSFRVDMSGLKTSEHTEDTLPTYVRKGVTIGANATVGCGIEMGEFSMVGMGSVVTKNVVPHGLVFGNPSILRGLVCVCGRVLMYLEREEIPNFEKEVICGGCRRKFNPQL